MNPETKDQIGARIKSLLASSEYQLLLRRLANIIERETEKPFRPADLRTLDSVISTVAGTYICNLVLSDWLTRLTLRELREPLVRVIELLEQDANRELIGPFLISRIEMRSIKQPGKSVDDFARNFRELATTRYEALLRNLHELACKLPRPPEKPGRGRPAKAENLEILVRALAQYWEEATGKPFKQHWHKGAPVSSAVCFAHEVTRFVDGTRLRSLPKVTERIVSERRAYSRN
jgi:hypothetical protein